MAIGWTDDRRQLAALLAQREPDAAELYRRAVDGFASAALTRPALMVSAHCVRELIAMLPTVLGDERQPRANVERAAKQLSTAWENAELLPPEPDSHVGEPTPRAIPHDVYRAAHDVVTAAVAGSQNSRLLTATVATGATLTVHTPQVNRLHREIEKFRKWCHRRDYTRPEVAMPPTEEIESALNTIEQALLDRLGNMADRVAVVLSAVDAANRKAVSPDD